VLDRASTFADPEVVEMLKTKFVPVAIDQWYQRRQKDAEGDFYRKIAGQGPRNDFKSTTQGLYAAAPDGTLYIYTNSRQAHYIEKQMKEALAKHKPSATAAVAAGSPDKQFNPQLPEGGLVVRVQAKVLGGYEPTDDAMQQIFQNAVSRDNLWMTGAEHAALARGEFPGSLQRKIARFHLIDNTRGEPPMWKPEEVKDVSMSLNDGVIIGRVHVETANSDRGYTAEFRGHVDVSDGKVSRFDLVAKGLFWGQGGATGNPPPGKFPLGISFSLTDGSDSADSIPPQASRGWLRGYMID
jgi:hypothetical protein